MTNIISSRISGEFTGFDGDAIFELDNGQAWQQAEYKYLYKYAYRPRVQITREAGRYFLEVEGVPTKIRVFPVDIVIEGTISSDFEGFNGDSIFQFDNGQKWQQAEYKYNYHYAYRPRALIISSGGDYILKVEGMDETVRVRKI